MGARIQVFFTYAVAVFLFTTAIGKFLIAFESTHVLAEHDFILKSLTCRQLLVIRGTIEIILSAYLLAGSNRGLKMALVAWFSTAAIIYLVGLHYLGTADVFSCSGNFTSWLPILPRVLDRIMFIATAVLLVGSYSFLVLGWLGSRLSGPETVTRRVESTVETAKA